MVRAPGTWVYPFSRPGTVDPSAVGQTVSVGAAVGGRTATAIGVPIDLPIMSGNRSLDEFAGARADPDADGDGDNGSGREQGGTGEDIDDGEAGVDVDGAGDDDAIGNPAEDTPMDAGAEAEVEGQAPDVDATVDIDDGPRDANPAGRDDDGAGDPDETATAPGTSGDRTPDLAPASAPTPVLRWSSEAAACDRCGERIRRRWAEGEAYVCTACKDW